MLEEVQTSMFSISRGTFLEKYRCIAETAIQTHDASTRFQRRKNILLNFQPSQQSNPSYPQEVAIPDRQTIEPNITNPAVVGYMQSIGTLQTE